MLGSHREAAGLFPADQTARRGDREREGGIAIRLALAAGRLSDPTQKATIVNARSRVAIMPPNAFAASPTDVTIMRIA